MSRPAVFLDRDGTLIEDLGYLRDPRAVRLLPGIGAALARLDRAGLPAVVVTNQSGIARGLLSEAQYRETERRLDDLLAIEGVALAGHYFCPHLPEITGPCGCRKPGTLLYRRAAVELGLDLAASWWVGDRARDVLPARVLGGRGILLAAARPARQAGAAAFAGAADFWAPDLATAVDTILGAGESSRE